MLSVAADFVKGILPEHRKQTWPLRRATVQGACRERHPVFPRFNEIDKDR